MIFQRTSCPKLVEITGTTNTTGQSKALFYAEELLGIYTGIDFWCTRPSAVGKAARRWKQWLIALPLFGRSQAIKLLHALF